MTVPVTGGSRGVDEETLHEFHLGFFGFIFTCNSIPVYFSLPIPPPLALSPVFSIPSLPPPVPSPTPSPSLLPCPLSPGDLGGVTPTGAVSHSGDAPRSQVLLCESCVISTRARGALAPLLVHLRRFSCLWFSQGWGLAWGPMAAPQGLSVSSSQLNLTSPAPLSGQTHHLAPECFQM